MKTYIVLSPIKFNDYVNYYHEGDKININSHYCFEKDSIIFLYFKNCSKQGVYALCKLSTTQKVLDDIAINKAIIERKETYPMITSGELEDLGIDSRLIFESEIKDEDVKQSLFYLMDRYKPYVMNNCLKAEEVAKILDISIGQLNYWYTFKRKHPNNPYSKLLPNYIQFELTTLFFYCLYNL